MTISRGQPWGEEITRPTDVQLASSDAELAALVARDPTAAIGVRGGDVFRTLGRPARAAVTAQRLPMDLLHVEWAGGEHLAVAHVVLRNRWWRGPIVAAMNVGSLGTWEVAPAAHPNDGLVDIVSMSALMPMRTRLAVRRRLATGSHLPHPQISVRRMTSTDLAVSGGAELWIDGVRHGHTDGALVRVEPDAYDLIC